mgnify:CR=1 FL=1
MNKKANWTLPAILGAAAVSLIVFSLAGAIPKGWVILGLIFLYLAFAANSQ